VVDSNFRAYTLHGTQGVLLEGNVAFNVAGHAYFFEDGGRPPGEGPRHRILRGC
jgi:hypothetical protein